MRNKKLFIIVLFILVAIAVDANTLYTYNNAKPESISDNEGLNNSPINYIYQDSIGYLWFATKTNLLKYDGETIVNYLEKSTNFPTKNIIFITSKNSKLYFVTNYNIDILDSRNNKLKTFYYNKYFKNKGKPSLIVSCFIDKKNNLWVATKSGLYKSIKEKGQISNFKLITLDKKHPSLFITKLCQDKYDNIWIGTNIGVYIYNEKIDKAINIEDYYWQIQPYMVSNIKKDNKGNIWIGQTKRIIKFDNSHNYFSEKDIQPSIYFLPDNNTYNYVIDFSFDKNGNLWVLKPHMVNVIEFNKKSYKTHTLLGNQDNSSSYDLASLMIDKQGLVYIGSNEGDITLYNPYSNTIKTKYPNNYYGSFNINCACKDYKGNIWLGVDDNKLFYYISKEDRFIELKFNNDFIIRNIFETKKHEIFFTSMSNNLYKGGLFKIKNTESFYKTYNKEILLLKLYNSSNIEKIDNKFNLAYFATQDYDGSLWYISINGGTYHLNYKNGEITLIDNFNTNNYNKHKLENVIGENINLLSDSSLFISSSLYNMIKYNRNNNTFQNCYLLNKYMYINNINGFNFSYLDKKEKHWFGTDGGGLIQYHKNDSTHYTIFNKNNGFISNNINSLVVDKNNKMWIGTADGITVLDTSKNIYRINKKDGLRNEFINIFSSFSLNDSIICFGGRGGINLINTNTILNKINNTNSSIGISSIKNNGLDYFSNSKRRAISNPNKISTLYIKSSDNITINISTLSFSYPKENSITYRLLPKYKEWKTNAIGDKNITLKKLTKGNYILQCRVINSNGKTSNIQKNITIIVTDPIYLKWWFYLTIIIIIFTLIYVSQFILKINIIKKNKKLKELVNKQTKELLYNNEKLQQKTQELATFNETRTKMFSVISQNLIKPLGNITDTNHYINENYKELLINGQLKTFINDNNTPLSSLYELLQNLLFWSKQQDSSVKMNLTNFNLNDLYLEVNSFLEFELNSKENIIKNKIPKQIDLYADKQMIHIILRNILSQYNLLTNKSSTIITASQKGTYIQISISNKKITKINGTIFETINLKDFNTSNEFEKIEDTNLKLAVTKKFIHNHNGKMQANYSKEDGLVITFTIARNLYS